MEPSLSKQALGEVTNSSSHCQKTSNRAAWLVANHVSAHYKTSHPQMARPPRARRTSLIPSVKPFSKSSSVKIKKANGRATTISSHTNEASLAARSTLTFVKNETVKEESQNQVTMQQLQEENLHLKIDKFNLLKELHYAYSMFVTTGYRCTDLELENKQLRQDQESLRQELLALKTNNNNNNKTKTMTMHNDKSSHDDNNKNE